MFKTRGLPFAHDEESGWGGGVQLRFTFLANLSEAVTYLHPNPQECLV